jgi:hypothetical protein
MIRYRRTVSRPEFVLGSHKSLTVSGNIPISQLFHVYRDGQLGRRCVCSCAPCALLCGQGQAMSRVEIVLGLVLPVNPIPQRPNFPASHGSALAGPDRAYRFPCRWVWMRYVGLCIGCMSEYVGATAPGVQGRMLSTTASIRFGRTYAYIRATESIFVGGFLVAAKLPVVGPPIAYDVEALLTSWDGHVRSGSGVPRRDWNLGIQARGACCRP